MTLAKALKGIKKSLYALFVYREEEPFSYIRDTDELTDSTEFTLKSLDI